MAKIYNILMQFLIIICSVSLCGAVVYRLYALNNLGVIISLILASICYIIILLLYKKFNTGSANDSLLEEKEYGIIIKWLLLIAYIFLLTFCFFILYSSQTADAIISPWEIIPSYFFFYFCLLTVFLIINIFINKKISIFLLSLHYFLVFSIALIVYKIGYGFDPFIHQATVKLISEKGAVDPKPFYYLGQYALIVIIHKLFFIPLAWLDKLLVPFMAALFLPITFYEVLKNWFIKKEKILLTILLLLIFPFSYFIVTTPQNLAYLLLILIILLGFSCKNIFDLSLIFLLAFATISIQPIAGIPALFFALVLTLYHSNHKIFRSNLYRLLFIFSTLSLPLAFRIVEYGHSSPGPELSNSINWPKMLSWPKLVIPGNESFILNFIYLYGNNIKFIIITLLIIGLAVAYKHRNKCKIFSIYALMSASLFLSYMIIKLLPFNFLIAYERTNYADRILIIAGLFLLPFILLAIYKFIFDLFKQKKSIVVPILSFFVILISTSLYLSYPRFDNFHNSRGYSVGKNDIEAVRWIENDAPTDYIVLANQQVSAAALHEFGFKKYFQISSPPYREGDREGVQEIFYYPIPTGGPLYQFYLDMVYEKPSLKTINKAKALTGVETAYFVLNKYWWAFPKILEEAKLSSINWHEIGNGKVFVFKY